MGGFENMFNEVSDSIIKQMRGEVKEKETPSVVPAVKVEKPKIEPIKEGK